MLLTCVGEVRSSVAGVKVNVVGVKAAEVCEALSADAGLKLNSVVWAGGGGCSVFCSVLEGKLNKGCGGFAAASGALAAVLTDC